MENKFHRKQETLSKLTVNSNNFADPCSNNENDIRLIIVDILQSEIRSRESRIALLTDKSQKFSSCVRQLVEERNNKKTIVENLERDISLLESPVKDGNCKNLNRKYLHELQEMEEILEKRRIHKAIFSEELDRLETALQQNKSILSDLELRANISNFEFQRLQHDLSIHKRTLWTLVQDHAKLETAAEDQIIKSGIKRHICLVYD